MRPIQDVELKLDRCRPVTKLRLLRREGSLVDAVDQHEVDQPVLLSDQERRLALHFRPAGARVVLRVVRLRGQHVAEPVAHVRFGDFHAVEDRQYLLIERLFGDASPSSRWAETVRLRAVGASESEIDAALARLDPAATERSIGEYDHLDAVGLWIPPRSWLTDSRHPFVRCVARRQFGVVSVATLPDEPPL